MVRAIRSRGWLGEEGVADNEAFQFMKGNWCGVWWDEEPTTRGFVRFLQNDAKVAIEGTNYGQETNGKGGNVQGITGYERWEGRGAREGGEINAANALCVDGVLRVNAVNEACGVASF